MKKGIFNTKAEELDERTVRFKISSEVVDRDGDTLIAKGCDFTNFAKNPQFLSFHNYHEYPLGIPKNWGVEGDSVYCDVYFPTVEELSTDPEQASEKAKLVDFTYHCYQTGMLNAVSVGFIAKETEPDTKTGGFIVKNWELLEFSAVAVPANQDAIAQAVKSFGDNGKQIVDPTERCIELEKQLEACHKTIKEQAEILLGVKKDLKEVAIILDDEEYIKLEAEKEITLEDEKLDEIEITD